MRLICTAILLLINSLLWAQESAREYADGPLSWGDFAGAARNAPRFEFNIYLVTGTQLIHDNDTLNREFVTKVLLDRESSWVHKGARTDQTLYYLQLLFDVAHYYAEVLRFELEEAGVRKNIPAKTMRFNEIVKRQIAQINKECDMGRNHIPIKRWRKWLETQEAKLENRKRVLYETDPFGISASIGGNVHMFYQDFNDLLNPGLGFHSGVALSYDKFGLHLDYHGANALTVLANSAVDWQDGGEAFKYRAVNLSASYQVFDSHHFTIRPYAGLNMSSIAKRPYKSWRDSDWKSVASAPVLGLEVDKKILRLNSKTPHPKMGLRYYTESAIQLKVFVTGHGYYEELSGLGLNISLAYSFFGKKLKNVMPN